MILAAGEGTRFRPHTLTLPKPAIPFLNVPLLGYSQYLLSFLPIENLVVNTFHLPEAIVNLMKVLPPISKNYYISNERAGLLGTGGGIKHAESFLASSENIVIINGDELILPKDLQFLKNAYAEHLESGSLATLIVMKHPEVGKKFSGVWTDPENKLLGFGKTNDFQAINGWHYIGIQFLSRRIFSYLKPKQESNIFYDCLRLANTWNETVRVFEIDCYWHEMGNISDYLEATGDCLNFLTNSTHSTESQLLKNVHSFYHGNKTSFIWHDKISNAKIFANEPIRLAWQKQVEGPSFLVLGPDVHLNELDRFKNSVLGPNSSSSGTGKLIENQLILTSPAQK